MIFTELFLYQHDEMEEEQGAMEEILRDFQPGPLDFYRKQATFKWQDMKLLMASRKAILLKVPTISQMNFYFIQQMGKLTFKFQLMIPSGSVWLNPALLSNFSY